MLGDMNELTAAGINVESHALRQHSLPLQFSYTIRIKAYKPS